MLAKDIVPPQVDITLAEHAAVIRALGKRVVHDVVEIGRRLTECKEVAGHGNWLPWLDREFGWTEQTALNFMRVHEAAEKSKKFLDLSLPVSGLYLLAAPSTPEEAVDSVVEQASKGKKLSLGEIKRIVKDARDAEADKYEKKILALIKRYDTEVAELRTVFLLGERGGGRPN